jgi:hypothetical protein
MAIEDLLEPGESLEQLRKAFMRNVVPDISGCWYWRGVKDAYGTFRGKPAHCVSWELHQSPIPVGLYILHGCNLVEGHDDAPYGCVNPAHLRPGTPRENAVDRRRAEERALIRASRVARAKRYDKGIAQLEMICADAMSMEEVTLTLPRWCVSMLRTRAQNKHKLSLGDFLRDTCEDMALENGYAFSEAYDYVRRERVRRERPEVGAAEADTFSSIIKHCL